MAAQEPETTDDPPDSDVTKAVAPIIAALSAFLTWLSAGSKFGPELASLFSAFVGVCGLASALIYRRYVAILGVGGQPEGSPERQAYDDLRASLAGGNLPARLYRRWLKRFLDAVDRFFGDAGLAGRSLFPRAFGLKTPAPLWTAPAFDRCLFLALLYPIATIFVIWAVSGDVGPAEAALGLKPEISAWLRGFTVAVVGFEGLVLWRFGHIRSTARLAVTVAAAAAGAVAVTIAFTSAGAGAIAFACAMGAAVASAGRVAGAIAVAVAAPVALALAFAFAGVSVGAFALIVAAAGAGGMLLLCAIAIKHHWQGVFFLLFLPTMILACLGAAAVLAPLRTWQYIGPLLLFLGLLTLINAPFNWASLGLTRALLRRGLELGGWWPLILALADAAFATLIVALLSLAMVIGVQAFDELAELHGGAPVLPLKPLFDGMAKHPAAPEYWWAYALLLATMVPSLINLMIGGASLARGAPGLPSVLLRFLPVGKAVPNFDRAWIALVLTLQVLGGWGLGVMAQALAVWLVIGHVLPLFGSEALDMADAIAAFDAPRRLAQLFAGVR